MYRRIVYREFPSSRAAKRPQRLSAWKLAIGGGKSAVLLPLILTLIPISLFGQSLGFGVRYGAGTSPDVSDGIVIVGAEGELFARPQLVVSARGDVYLFGFGCTGFGGCPNQVKSLSLGALYRTPASTSSFYLGGDAGRTWWAGDLQGWLARPRAGADIRLVPYVYLNAEVAYTRFINSVPAGQRDPADQVLGVSAGLRIRL